MKRAAVIPLMLVIAMVFSSCSFKISSSVDDLISPVSPFGDNADIKEAMDDFLPKGYSLKTPNQGEFITAYNFLDIDSDGKDEAIAFYEPSDNLGTLYMAVIKNSGDNWNVVENIEGFGADVSSLGFEDVTGNGKNDLIVCWDAISKSVNHELALYEYGSNKQNSKLNCFYHGITVNNYIAVDMTGDKTKELLLFEISSGNYSRAKAELYSFKNGSEELLGETKLDAHISSYINLTVENYDGENRVYADALGTDGSSLLTEMIYWSDGYDSIISPFYQYSSGLTSGTTRSVIIPSMDVNGDGRIEIPCDMGLKKLPKSVACCDWRVHKNDYLAHTDYSISPKKEKYLVIIPDKYIERIRVKYDVDNRLMTVFSTEGGGEVFSVKSVLKARYKKKDYKDYTRILEDKGYYYLAKASNNKNINITVEDLKSLIKNINQEEN
ncbi:MAG: VCBS repeat-containing protein [Ruminococcaceae bacterium]|nr:VCBS repeat-containing protein [Oscillospiraceae bacterium]